MRTLLLSLLSLSLPATLVAQNTIVSSTPASATVEGSASNAFPWVTNLISRYMQVHSDVGGASRSISKLAFRRNGVSMPQPGGTRTVDLEVWMGESVAWDRITFVYDNNYVMPKTLVLPRVVLNLGPVALAGNPAPFEIVVPLSAPFAYTGVNSLAWECSQYSNVASGLTVTLDSETGTTTNGAAATLTGPGCIATGQSLAMDLGVQSVDRGGAYQFGVFVKQAPSNAPTFVYFGTNNFNLPVPGLCSNVLTDLSFQVLVGNSDNFGYVGERATGVTDHPSALCTFVVPNTIGGVTLFVQAHSIDAGQSGLPFCNSNGYSFSVPMPNRTVVAPVSRLYNFPPQGPGFPRATPLTLTNGYGSVVEFTY